MLSRHLPSSAFAEFAMSYLEDIPLGLRCRVFVGGFLQKWAFMEADLRHALQNGLGLDPVQAAIVAANIQLRDKIGIVRTISQLEIIGSDDEKKEIEKKLIEIADYATKNRNMMAHNMFTDSDDGAVHFAVIRAKGKFDVSEAIWDEAKFEEASKKIEEFSVFLKELGNRLSYAKLARLLTAPVKPTPEHEGPGLLGSLFRHSPGTPDSSPDPATPGTNPQTPPTEPQ
jgi:hypothetical protein